MLKLSIILLVAISALVQSSTTPLLLDETTLDPCRPNPCHNGGMCRLTGNSFKCSCEDYFYGDFCEKQEHICDRLYPCRYDSECVENGTDYYCICRPGITGIKCDKSEWCLHIGDELCADAKCFYDFRSNKSFCQCGSSLMFNMKSRKCEPRYCGDHGTYKTINNTKTCECEENYVEKDGICVELPVTTVLSTTVTPTKRHICEISNPCENGGECIADGDVRYFCRCPEGLTGKDCTKSQWCVNVGYEVCGPKTLCVYDSVRKISYCKCENSLLFNMKTRRCEVCYCGVHGTCLSEDGMKSCDCEENYIERDGFCTEQVTTPYISTAESTTIITPSCDCGSKSYGCTFDRYGRQKCVCFPGFAQKENVCTETCLRDSDCLNGGSCIQSGDDHFCACPDGFSGSRCQVDSACDKCAAMRAVCRRTRDGSVCECPPEKAYKWFTGVCEDICDSRKCANGKCEIMGQTFTCKCDKGFTGSRCEEKVLRKQDTSVYMIGFVMLSVAILLSTIGFCCLVCFVRRPGKESQIE